MSVKYASFSGVHIRVVPPDSIDLLTSENDGISLEDLKFVHLSLGHLHDRVVILLGILHLELVWSLLAVQNRSRKVFLTTRDMSCKEMC